MAAKASSKKLDAGFELMLSNGDKLACDKLLLAIGGCRTPVLGQLAVSLGHTLEPPVPSLFTFHIETPWLRELAGVSLEKRRGFSRGCKTSRTRRIAHHALGFKRPGNLEVVGLGGTHAARQKLPFPAASKLAA